MVARPPGSEAGSGGLGEFVLAGLVRPPSLVRQGASAPELGVDSGRFKSPWVRSDAFLLCTAEAFFETEGLVNGDMREKRIRLSGGSSSSGGISSSPVDGLKLLVCWYSAIVDDPKELCPRWSVVAGGLEVWSFLEARKSQNWGQR